MLTSDDIALLQKLQASPLKSYYALSDELGKSAHTVKKRYLHLESRFPGSFRVKADIDFARINLELVDAYIALHRISDADLVEQALQIHEYIKFTSRCIGIGENSGVYAQFSIPVEGIPFLREYLDILKNKGFVSKYSLYTQSLHRFIKIPELDAWNFNDHKWEISNQDILTNFQKIPTQPENLPPKSVDEFSLNNLDKTQLIILEELSFDSRRSDRQIYKDRQEMDQLGESMRSSLKLDVSFSTFARAMNKVDPHRATKQGYAKLRKSPAARPKDPGLILGYRLHYSAELFSIFDTCIFKGHPKSLKRISQLYHLIEENNPFKLRMNFMLYDNNEFAWYLPVPSQYLKPFTQGLTEFISTDFQIIWVNYGSSENFSFWPENFDLDSHVWKCDRKLLVENPLKILNLD